MRSAPKRKGDPTTLPSDVLKHVASFLHPVNTVALRQTSRAFRGAVNRHPTKRNALRSLAIPFSRYSQPEGMYPAAQNRFIMNTSGRRYMKHDQARMYLEKMFTHKGNGNIFGASLNPSQGMGPLVFPGMYGAVPTDHQRLALARAITGDNSKEGIDFMYKLIKRIRSRRNVRGAQSAVSALSPRSLASMYSKKGPGRRKVL
eukprot:910130-Prymnesium_polylepis.1